MGPECLIAGDPACNRQYSGQVVQEPDPIWGGRS
jgi:hypothetical protein